MKNLRTLTRRQKEIVSKVGLVPNNWLIKKETKNALTLINKASSNEKVVHI